MSFQHVDATVAFILSTNMFHLCVKHIIGTYVYIYVVWPSGNRNKTTAELQIWQIHPQQRGDLYATAIIIGQKPAELVILVMVPSTHPFEMSSMSNNKTTIFRHYQIHLKSTVRGDLSDGLKASSPEVCYWCILLGFPPQQNRWNSAILREIHWDS